MYKTLLDHRFAAEFDQLKFTRGCLIDQLAAAAQQVSPARSARTGARLEHHGLEGDTHPLTASWLKFDTVRHCPSVIESKKLPADLVTRLERYTRMANEHVANRSAAKQLISELEAAVHRRELALEWPEGAFAMGHRPIKDITRDLNKVLQLS